MSHPPAPTARYARQLLLPEWGGEEGQARLAKSDVLVVGAGGIGSPLLYYLTAAGVGRIRVCDGDVVELSNLNRQILHRQDRIGMNKARSAGETLSLLNPEIEIVVHEESLTADTAEGISAGAHLVCCAVDDLETTRILGHLCVRKGIPLVWGGAYHLAGFVTIAHPPGTPCVECSLKGWERAREKAAADPAGHRGLFLPTAEKPGPIAGAAAGAAGSIQAMEAIKLLVGFGPTLKGSMLTFQLGGSDMGFRTLNVEPARRPGCPDCGTHDPA